MSKTSKRLIPLALLMSMAIPIHAQLPDGPRPVIAHAIVTPLTTPRFWSLERKLSTGANVALRTYDTIQTCRALQIPGAREEWLPTQSCRGVALWSAGFAGGSFVAERLLWRRHPRLALLPQWLSASGAAAGILSSRQRPRTPRLSLSAP